MAPFLELKGHCQALAAALGWRQGPAFGGDAMIDITSDNHNEQETSPFQETCPRHGMRVQRHHGCPKCVMEEVRRHERRIHVPLEQEASISPNPSGSVSPLSIEIL